MKIMSLETAMAAEIATALFAKTTSRLERKIGIFAFCRMDDERAPVTLCCPPDMPGSDDISGSFLLIADKFRSANDPEGILKLVDPPTIQGVKYEDLIVLFSSNLSPDENLAAAVIYAHWHYLVQEEVNKAHLPMVDEDILLMHLGSWQKQYAPDNQIIVPLAQSIFKSELVDRRETC